jgi:Ni,Fe-hydrogenase III small subunit/NAD-dependent dihydropyrimidine dehydrogenase PreA subunit
MLSALIAAIKQRRTTDPQDFPDLPEGVRGLPRLTDEPCLGGACSRCASACPTGAITLEDGRRVALDRGLCVTCGACVESCPTKTIAYDRSTRTAVRRREDLILRQADSNTNQETVAVTATEFARSVDVREVSTGCNATDLEVAATTNPIFDCSRFGVSFVASPRFADALIVTGPVGKAMHEPLLRCYEAMAEPRIVIAVGTCAVSGGLHRGGYAEANGVTPHLPVQAFVPGCPPHPWSIIHGVLLAVGSNKA